MTDNATPVQTPAHPLARSAAKNLIHGASADDRLRVIQRCDELEGGVLTGVQLWCVASLEEFVELTGETLSVGKYEKWRAGRSRPFHYASVGEIRSAFEKWSRAVRHVTKALPDPEFGSSGRPKIQHSKDGVDRAIGTWLSEIQTIDTYLGISLLLPGTVEPYPKLNVTSPPFTNYRVYAKAVAELGQPFPLRRESIFNFYPDWLDALGAANARGHHDPEVRAFISLALLSKVGQQNVLLEVLEQAALVLGPQFKMDEFAEFRSARLANPQSEDERRLLEVFSAPRIKTAFGGWFYIHRRLAPENPTVRDFRPPHFIPDDELLAAARNYLDSIEDDGSITGYRDWRDGQEDPAIYPASKTMTSRLGDWRGIALRLRGES